jgi:hypothetical protein
MKSGVHQQSLVDALSEANQILILKPENQDWDIDALFSKDSLFVCVEDIVDELSRIQQGHFVVMSNVTTPFLTYNKVDIKNAIATSAAVGMPIAISGSVGFIMIGTGIEGATSGFVVMSNGGFDDIFNKIIAKL